MEKQQPYRCAQGSEREFRHLSDAHTEFHVREEAERASPRTALDETNDVDPKLHVFGRRACSGVHEKG